MIHTKQIPIPIYNGQLIVTITDEWKPLKKYFLTKKASLFAHTLDTNCTRSDGLRDRAVMIVLNPFNKYTTVSAHVIAHESAHAAAMVLGYIGAQADYTNDEAYCYLVGWFVEQVYLHIIEQKLESLFTYTTVSPNPHKI